MVYQPDVYGHACEDLQMIAFSTLASGILTPLPRCSPWVPFFPIHGCRCAVRKGHKRQHQRPKEQNNLGSTMLVHQTPPHARGQARKARQAKTEYMHLL